MRPLEDIERIIQESRQTDFPIVDGNGVLVGMLSSIGLRDAVADGTPPGVLPAVDPSRRDRLVGVVSRQDLLGAYERALAVEGH